MGIIKNNQNVSGLVGNLVFVNTDGRLLVRTRPGKVKQTAATKRAASQFGYVSAADCVFRNHLVSELRLFTDKGFAYRHRALMGKMCERIAADGKPVFSFDNGNPKALEGFNFNLESPWEKRCNFFAEFDLDDAGNLSVHIPVLRIGEEIKNQQGLKKAVVDFWLVSAVPPEPGSATVNLLWNESIEVLPNTPHSAVNWGIPDCPQGQWLLMVASCRYELAQPVRRSNSVRKILSPASVYLWGGRY